MVRGTTHSVLQRRAAEIRRGGLEASPRRAALALATLLALGLATAPPGVAALTADQQKCARTLHRDLAKVSEKVGQVLATCVRDIGKGKRKGSLEDCVTRDRGGEIRAALARTRKHDSKFCEGNDDGGVPRRPEGLAELASTVNTVGEGRGSTLLSSLFGDGAQPIRKSDDKNAAACQRTVAKSVSQCQDVQLDSFARCARQAMRDGADTAEALEACVLADPEGEIAAACDADGSGEGRADKVRRKIAGKCSDEGVDLCEAFPHCCPPCAGGDTECIHQCVQLRSECSTCRNLNEAAGLSRDCDAACLPFTVDPGTDPWPVVPRDRVIAECGMDPDVLDEISSRLGNPWAIIRYGKICYEHYPEDQAGKDVPRRNFSATKTMGALVTGIAAYETRDIQRTGPKTGPLLETDRVDHWLDSFSFNPDAQVAHVLGMVAYNDDLSFESMIHRYDGDGSREINRLSDIVNTAIAQDPDRLGSDLEEFTQRYLYAPLGMTNSTWSNGAPDKIYGISWTGTLHDMARVGQTIIHDGIYDGRRVLDPQWVYNLTHPSFEDANTAYGYLTWLSAKSNHTFGGILGLEEKLQTSLDPCSPAPIHASFPHGASEATDCYYDAPWTCEQEYDVGVWAAIGFGGQLIVGHKGLDLVLVGHDQGQAAFAATLWNAMRPAFTPHEPNYPDDDAAFCAAYGAGSYAPDLPEQP